MNRKSLLIVFAKNTVLGKVKTRLAKTVGDINALNVYIKLKEKTAEIIQQTSYETHLFYSDFIEQDIVWDNVVKQKHIQLGNDLGERMSNAFQRSFKEGYSRVILIGTDLWTLEKEDIIQGFETLKEHSFTIGPAQDGGYYLIGMTRFKPDLFQDKKWGESDVFEKTMKNLVDESVYLLKEKNDIDYYEDLLPFEELNKIIKTDDEK